MIDISSLETFMVIIWFLLLFIAIGLSITMSLGYFGFLGFMARWGINETLARIEHLKSTEDITNLDDVTLSTILILKHRLPFKFYWAYSVSNVYTLSNYKVITDTSKSVALYIEQSKRRGKSTATVHFREDCFVIRLNDSWKRSFYYCDPNCFVDFVDWFLKIPK